MDPPSSSRMCVCVRNDDAQQGGRMGAEPVFGARVLGRTENNPSPGASQQHKIPQAFGLNDNKTPADPVLLVGAAGNNGGLLDLIYLFH